MDTERAVAQEIASLNIRAQTHVYKTFAEVLIQLPDENQRVYNSNENLKLQINKWMNYMQSVRNSFTPQKYEMVLKEALTRFTNSTQQNQALNEKRRIKRNGTMQRRMEPATFEGVAYFKSKNGFAFIQDGDQYKLIGARDYIYEESDSKKAALAQLAAQNQQLVQQSRLLKLRRLRPGQEVKMKNKKLLKKYYLDGNQLKNLNKLRSKQEIDDNEFRGQTQGAWTGRIARKADQIRALTVAQLGQKLDSQKAQMHKEALQDVRTAQQDSGKQQFIQKNAQNNRGQI